MSHAVRSGSGGVVDEDAGSSSSGGGSGDNGQGMQRVLVPSRTTSSDMVDQVVDAGHAKGKGTGDRAPRRDWWRIFFPCGRK